MQWWELVVLGVVQGLTEFLPISSSGHLVVVEALLSRPAADVNIVLHGGTLITILIYYRRSLVDLIVRRHRLAALVLLGTIPAGVVGIVVKRNFEHVLESPLLAGVMLWATGGLLLWARRQRATGKSLDELGVGGALWVGLFQAAAILPGISRSGSTVVAGMSRGLDRRSAAEFSFLLAVPVIGGACLLEAKDVWEAGGASTPISWLLLGASISCVVGLFALRWLIAWLEQDRLHWFAAWCFAVGAAVVIWQLTGASPS